MEFTMRAALLFVVLAALPAMALGGRYDQPGTRDQYDQTPPPPDGRYDRRDVDHRYEDKCDAPWWDRHDDDFECPRFYFGLGPLYAFEHFHTASHVFTGGTGTAVGADDSYGAEGRLGYRIHEHVALEAQAQYYGRADINAHPPTGTTNVGSFEGVSATGNVKLYPITGRFQPYVLGGIGLLWAHIDNDLPGARRGNLTELAGRGGLGLDVYLNEHVALNVEGSYLAPASNLKQFPLAAVSSGLQVHF